MILSNILQTRGPAQCINSLMNQFGPLLCFAFSVTLPVIYLLVLAWRNSPLPEGHCSLEFSNSFETGCDTISWELQDHRTLAWPHISSPRESQQGLRLSVCSVLVMPPDHLPAHRLATDGSSETLKSGQQLQALAEAWKGCPPLCEGAMNCCSQLGTKCKWEYFCHDVQQLSF